LRREHGIEKSEYFKENLEIFFCQIFLEDKLMLEKIRVSDVECPGF
jgi:hypothetical protein